MISVMIIRDIVLAQRVKMSSISEEILELEKALDDDKYFFFPFTPSPFFLSFLPSFFLPFLFFHENQWWYIFFFGIKVE